MPSQRLLDKLLLTYRLSTYTTETVPTLNTFVIIIVVIKGVSWHTHNTYKWHSAAPFVTNYTTDHWFTKTLLTRH